MICESCLYYKVKRKMKLCEITHTCNTISCGLNDDTDVENMDICFNCKSWIGGGDWGLSCEQDYYNTNTNGFHPACDNFKRKDRINGIQ